MNEPVARSRSEGIRRPKGDRFILGYCAAVLAATLGGSLGVALSLGGMPVGDFGVTAIAVAIYSAVVVGALGPIGHIVLSRMRLSGPFAYAAAGAVLGGGFMSAIGSGATLSDPFAIGGLLAGLCAGVAFWAVYRGPKGTA